MHNSGVTRFVKRSVLNGKLNIYFVWIAAKDQNGKNIVSSY